MLQPKPCNRIFERIHSGEIDDKVTFRGRDVFTVLSNKQVTSGHTLVVPVECFPSVDALPPDSARRLQVVSRATGIWLQVAFDPDYVGKLVAGKQVSHAHEHVVPCYEGRDWLTVMGSPDRQPFPLMSDDQLAEVFAHATLPLEYAEAVRAELHGGEALTYEQMTELAHDLAA